MDGAFVATRRGVRNDDSVSDFDTHETINSFKNYDELQDVKSWWSEWSEWSDCSRRCGGGIAKQTRTCLRRPSLSSFSVDDNGKNDNKDDYCLRYSTDKETTRYRICNMQCSEYNNQPYDGRLFKWHPVYSPENLCALVCRGEIFAENFEKFPDLIVQFAPQVKDGTHCSNDSLDMCINGKCQRVGCDLQIGSNKKLDRCGVCGGDGSGCAKSPFQWQIVTVTNCSTNSKYCLSGEMDSDSEGSEHKNDDSNEYDDEKENESSINTVNKTNNSNSSSRYYVSSEEKSDKRRLHAERSQQQKQLICKNIETDEQVENELCNGRSDMLPQQTISPLLSAEEIQKQQLEEVTALCTTVKCREHLMRQIEHPSASEFNWLTNEWSECLADCRSRPTTSTDLENIDDQRFENGIRTRIVRCIRVLSTNGLQFQVNEEMCKSPKPKSEEYCSITSFECPKWQAGAWGKCSESCGKEGVQRRQIKCFASKGQFSDRCDPKLMPPNTRTCRLQPRKECVTNKGLWKIGATSNWQSKKPPLPLFKSNAFNSINDENGDDNDTDENSADNNGDKETGVAVAAVRERLAGSKFYPTAEATFIVDNWSSCNATCGIGYRHRNVNCKIFLEFSQTIAKLPDHQCSGVKPSTYERCSEFLEPCAYQSQQQHESLLIDTVRDSAYLTDEDTIGRSEVEIGATSSNTIATYSWKEQGYSDCTTTCLGGTQHSQIRCVREDTQNIVPDQKCSFESKPETHTKLCNEHPCVPRWNYSEFTECSQPCGMGIQMRDVTCVHEISRSVFITVPNKMCPHPQPADRQFCNVLDCPARWHISAWQKCSKRCGPDGGIKTRRVDCRQVMAQNHIIDRPATQCPHPVPVSQKKCNEKPCPKIDTEYPSITISNSSYIQHDPKKEKITLKIGGSATIFYGATVKIKCPTERGFNRSQIEWLRDGKLLFETDLNNGVSGGEAETITSTNRLKHSKRGGTLRILHASYKDTGMYTCRASKSLASIFVRIKPRPGEFISSEEVENRRRGDDSASRNGKIGINSDTPSDSANRLLIVAEDQSHERKTTSSSSIKVSQSRTQKQFSHKIDDSESNKKILVVQSKPMTLSSTTSVASPASSTKTTTVSSNSISDSHVVMSSSAQRPQSSLRNIFGHLQATRYLANVFLKNNNHKNDNHNNFHKYNNEDEALVELMKQSRNLHDDDDDNNIGDNRDDTDNNDDKDDDEDDHNDEIIILGKGNAQDLKFFWYTSNWTNNCPKLDCETVENMLLTSRRPSFNNLQLKWRKNQYHYKTREVICKVQFLNTTYSVNKNLCEDARLSEPVSRQQCFGNNTKTPNLFCPKWSTSVWSDCTPTKCIAYQQALQTRAVKCLDSVTNRTVDNRRCSHRVPSNKSHSRNYYNQLWRRKNNNRRYYHSKPPKSERHCFQSQCRPVWVTGNWSKCNVPCDTVGLQYRSLGCYWQSNLKQSTVNCTIKNRPVIVQPCRISCQMENSFLNIFFNEVEHNHSMNSNNISSLRITDDVEHSHDDESIKKRVDCFDKYSTFCRYTRLICHSHQFRRTCCKSCRFFSKSTVVAASSGLRKTSS